MVRAMSGRGHRLLCLCALVLLGACGGADRERPFVVDIFPPDGAETPYNVEEVVFTYNEPVSVLNVFDIQVVLASGALFPVTVEINDNDPTRVRVRPVSGEFPVGERVVARTNEGAVINDRQHHAREIFQTAFTIAGEASIPAGAPGMVAMLDAGNFALESSGTTPAGRDPVGVASTIRAQTQRVWAQLNNGGGGGGALAFYETSAPGPMTVVPLSSTGNLVATVPTITVTHQGRFLYVAYRDEGSGKVRVARVDTRRVLEDFSMELDSVPAGPAAMPLGIGVTLFEDRVVVASADGAGGILSLISASTLTEIDLDPVTPGVQGLPLVSGGGPLAVTTDRVLVGPAANGGLDRVNLTTNAVDSVPAATLGTTSGMVVSRTTEFAAQSLNGFANVNSALVFRYREATDFLNGTVFGVSDDVGGASTGATDALSLTWYVTSERFALLLATPGGPIMTRWLHTPPFETVQEDLDDATAGIQAVDLSAILPGANVVGRTYGAYGD